MAEINFEGKTVRWGNTLTAEATSNNVFLGPGSLSSVSAKGEGNIAIGEGAGTALTVGVFNVAIGTKALAIGTETGANVAIGLEALAGATSGSENVALGRSAAAELTTATGSVAVGTKALQEDKTGGTNTAVGTEALKKTTGPNNTAVGASAGSNIGAGEKNTCLGYSTTVKAGSASNGNILIGNEAGANETLTERLFIHNKETTTPLIKGNMKTGSLELQFNCEKIGFFKQAPAAQEKVAEAAISEASVIVLANSIRAMLIATGLMKQ